MNFWRSVGSCALALLITNGAKFLLLANLMSQDETDLGFLTILAKNLINILDIFALDFIIRKKWLEGSNRLTKIYAAAYSWTFTSAVFANGLYIVTSTSGEEIEIGRFMNSLDFLAICGLFITGGKNQQGFIWGLIFIRFSILPFVFESNLLQLDIMGQTKPILSSISSLAFYILTKPFIKA